MKKLLINTEKSQFKLPIIVLPIFALMVYIIGDIIAGIVQMKLCDLSYFLCRHKTFLSLALAFSPALLIFLWVKFIELRKIQGLGFFKERILKDSLIGLATGFLSFLLVVFIAYLFGIIKFQSVNLNFKIFVLVLLIIPFWILQAGAEEIIVRGWLLPTVSAKSNKLIGIMLSAIVFVLFHFENSGLNVFAVLNIFLVGILLSLYVLATDNIWGAIFFHSFWNFTQGSFLGLSVSGTPAMNPRLMTMRLQGNSILSEGKFGIEASIITTVIISILIVIVLRLFYKDINKKTLKS